MLVSLSLNLVAPRIGTVKWKILPSYRYVCRRFFQNFKVKERDLHFRRVDGVRVNIHENLQKTSNRGCILQIWLVNEISLKPDWCILQKRLIQSLWISFGSSFWKVTNGVNNKIYQPSIGYHRTRILTLLSKITLFLLKFNRLML